MILLLKNFSLIKFFSVMFIAVLPFIEAKGAIPIGIGIGLSPTESFFVSYVGSMLPVPILLTLMIPFLEYLNSKTKFKKISQRLLNKINKKGQKIKKQSLTNNLDKPFKLMTLFTFVALPLPGTGVWSGSLVAALMNINKKRAFFTIALANLFASGLIFFVSMGLLV